MRLAHEDTLIAWSQERGAQVRGAVDTTLFSVDVGDDTERLELVAGGCELWVLSRGPFTLLATMSSVVVIETTRGTADTWLLTGLIYAPALLGLLLLVIAMVRTVRSSRALAI